MPLTDAKLRALKPKPAAYKVSDTEGLHILVPSNGSKLWRWAYRSGGKQKVLALGHYPDISLLDARRARDDARRLLGQGTDPSQARKLERLNPPYGLMALSGMSALRQKRSFAPDASGVQG